MGMKYTNIKKKILDKYTTDPARVINIIINKMEIYTYHFSDGKIYIGYTQYGLEKRHYKHKTCGISPLYKRLNNPETELKPKYETTVEVDIYSDELYKIQRKILDLYNIDTNQILNKNLYLFGY